MTCLSHRPYRICSHSEHSCHYWHNLPKTLRNGYYIKCDVPPAYTLVCEELRVSVNLRWNTCCCLATMLARQPVVMRDHCVGVKRNRRRNAQIYIISSFLTKKRYYRKIYTQRIKASGCELSPQRQVQDFPQLNHQLAWATRETYGILIAHHESQRWVHRKKSLTQPFTSTIPDSHSWYGGLQNPQNAPFFFYWFNNPTINPTSSCDQT